MQISNIKPQFYTISKKGPVSKPQEKGFETTSAVKSSSTQSIKIPFYGVIKKSRIENINVEQSQSTKDEQFSYEDYKKAKKYLQNKINHSSNLQKANYNIRSYDLDKLNGIQKGIKVFEGLSMKEIAFVFEKLSAISTNRGCNNRCSHCMVDATPQHFEKDSKMTSKMSWEDFSSLTKGIGELNKRLGLDMINLGWSNPYIMFFYDADGMELEMKDKAGNSYDFKKMNELFSKSIKKPVIFDTSGWSPKNEKLQKRAEKLVNYFKENKGKGNLAQINISMNPFHGLNTKAIHYKNAGIEISAEKMRNLYTDRMANALFTFTPLFEFRNFNILNRVVNDDDEKLDGFKAADLRKLHREITDKVQNLYEKDLSGEQKYIKCEEDIINNMTLLDKKLVRNMANIGPAGRASKLLGYGRNDVDGSDYKLMVNDMCQNLSNYEAFKIIDANGKVYLSDIAVTIPTEIQLNFENKHKETVPYGGVENSAIITKETIAQEYSKKQNNKDDEFLEWV